MRYLLLLFTLASAPLRAQFVEFGAGVGILNYTGDLIRTPDIFHSSLSFSGITRMNFSPVWSVKFSLLKGSISGSDKKPIDALGEARNKTFSHQLFELSSTVEYHFIDYRDDKTRTKWSPYIFMGIGALRLNDTGYTYEKYSPTQIVLPMGGGVKYTLTKQFTIDLGLGARKTFFDYLDAISEGDTFIKDYQYGNPKDTDWYFHSSVSVTYVLYKVKCPFIYKPNKSMTNRAHPK